MIDFDPQFPAWLSRLEAYGIAASALVAILLFFRAVREVIGRVVWQPIKRRLFSHGELLREIRENVHAIREQTSFSAWVQRVHADANELVGVFDCAATGENTHVSRTYARWMGCGQSDLLGWRFLNFTHSQDRDAVRAEWDRCRSEHREYRRDARMGPPGGPYRTYDIRIMPWPESPPAKAWTGTIRPVGDGLSDAEPMTRVTRTWGELDDGN